MHAGLRASVQPEGSPRSWEASSIKFGETSKPIDPIPFPSLGFPLKASHPALQSHIQSTKDQFILSLLAVLSIQTPTV